MQKRLVAAAMSFLAGTWGAQRFYLGNVGKGILFILFSWMGIPSIIGYIIFEEFERRKTKPLR